MLKHYLMMYLRSFARNRTFSIINILGLSTGIACSILILLWLADEFSFDRFHENSTEIFRVVGDDTTIGRLATSCAPLADYMSTNYQEVVRAAKYMPFSGSSFKYKDKLFRIEKGAFTDPAFLKMFSISFINGNPEMALNNPSDIVITESVAKKFFGHENPVGKALLVDGKDPLMVSAVVKDPPANSHLQFNFLFNAVILKYLGIPVDQWSNTMLYTFIQVRKNADIQQINSEIAGLMTRQIPGFNRRLFLQPLTDIHLNTSYSNDFTELGDKKYIYIFSAIAAFLILIACINFINLSTARILKRSREIGMRKVLGSSRLQVIKHYFIESLLFIITSFVFAIVLVEILLPVFNQSSGKTIGLNYLDVGFLGGVCVLLVIVAVLAGGYPALFLSSVKPVVVLKNFLNEKPHGLQLRKVLVVIQFSLSIVLMISTTVVFNQLNYIKNKKLGFEKENIIYFSAKGKFQQNYYTMKTELLKEPSIVDVTAEDRLLTNLQSNTNNLAWEGKDNKTDVHMEYSYIDYNYFDMLKVRFSTGRNFSKNMGTDRNAYILNEEAINQMKLKQPVGSRFVLNNREGNIIGVIRNTNFKSLHQKVPPTAYLVLDDCSNLSFVYNGMILVKAASGKFHDAISAIENLWKRENPDIPFEYHFLNETIEKQYVKESRTGKIFSYFSLIAIFISCLGLYGLTDFTIENRTKEIGVRKVLGASVVSILRMLLSDFIKLILLSSIFAVPVAWYIMNKWLQNFAYKVNIGWWVFVLAGSAALIIAILTISFRAIKAAKANPVESLKYE